MMFVVFNGFSEAARFKGISRISELMEKVADFMSENNLRKCMVQQVRKGELSGNRYVVWNTLGNYYYKTHETVTHCKKIREEAVC